MKNIAPLGPAPTPAREGPPAEAVDPMRRRLLEVIDARPPATVADLVAAVGGHPNTTRHHLRVLVRAGLVAEEHTPPTGGRGRPASRYALTPAGRAAVRDATAAEGAAAEEYVALAGIFAERLARKGGDPADDARAIGAAWGAGLADRGARDGDATEPARERVVGLLDRLGFSPVEQNDPAPHECGAVWLRTCPLLDAARRHPEVVCQVHLGLVAGALEAYGESSEGLRLEPFARPGACDLVLPATLGR